jgi:enediyne biosynthesis protein E4
MLMASCSTKETMFVEMSSSKTNIKFENNLPDRKLFNILYYLYYYNGGGVSAGDVNNDGLTDLYFTANNTSGNKLYLNKGNFEFEDITEQAGVAGMSDWCTGSTMADVNGDGHLDIYVCTISNAYGLEGHNELYINNGNNTFTERSAEYGLNFAGYSTQSAFFDFDRDGDLDCYLLNQSQKPHQNIVDTSFRRKVDPKVGDRFYRNDLVQQAQRGAAKFTDISAQAGIYQSNLGYGLGIAVADFNNDGWDDVYVGNDFHENDYYYLNTGNGFFRESGAQHFGHYSRFSMGNDAADYNNDGQIDLITVDMLPPDEKVLKTYGSDENADIYKFKLDKNGYQYQCSRNCLQRNNGDGRTFSETALISGVSATDWSWCPLFADFDNDGNKDLFVSSGIVKRPVDLDYIRFVSDLYVKKGANKTDKYDNDALEQMPDGSSRPFLFKGDGNISFTDVSEEWGTGNYSGYYNGAVYTDLDNDGRLDLVINSLQQKAVVLKNNSPASAWLSISFKGDGTNTKGTGAKAYVFANGKVQYQHLMHTRGFQSSVDTRLHFGLGNAQKVDSILVVWPDQRYQVIKDVKINAGVVADQKSAQGVFSYNEFFKPAQPVFNVQAASWKHTENSFDDFNVQYLLPHQLSTRGPKVAVADVNGDGLQDMYVCGAKGQPGALLLQKAGGTFSSPDTSLFSADRNHEDVDAVFFDANSDGSADLFVASGGNEYSGRSNLLGDRLYLNDARGRFTRSASIPTLFSNKSCVAVADYDKDGDQDVFVGTLADAKAYGVAQHSYLLINDGKANFSLADDNTIMLKNLGMVTSASFSDVDKNGYADLLVTGEWMPVTIFLNMNGKFTKTSIDNSTGLWQTVYATDVNKDGNTDLLLGNWGWNSKFWSGKDGPLRLYVSDYDMNGQTDQLLSYVVDGKEYPFLAKDEVERPLPLLKKHYLKYAEYAGVVMKDVFYGWIDTITPLQAERLGSALALNDGSGKFKLQDLPADMQLAPISAFCKVGDNRYIAGGNFFDVIPYEGKYDAQAIAVFTYENGIKVVPPQVLPVLRGQVRDVKQIAGKDGSNLVAVAVNNDTLRLMK